MQRATIAALLAITTVLAANPAEAQRRRGQNSILAKNRWLTSYNKAKTIAARTRQPMMVVFRCVP